MSLRQIQVRAPDECRQTLTQLCSDLEINGPILTAKGQGNTCLCIMTVKSGQTGSIINEMETRLGKPEEAGYFVAVLPVEAVIPRQQEDVEEDKERTAREELLEDVSVLTQLDRNFIIFVLLSSVIATFGLLVDDVAVVIGAMVIAPLLGPALSLSLGAVMADTELLKRGALAEFVGLSLSLAVAYTVATLLPGYAPELSQQIQDRTHPNIFHLILALGSGFAGALSLTGGISTALVGVMVAVALLSPTAVIGIGLAAGDLTIATGAGLLLLANLMGVVLAGILAFKYKGIHPGSWREVSEAKAQVRTVILVIVGLLLITGVPMGRITLATIQEAQLRSRVGEVAQSVVPGYGWSLDAFVVDGSTTPPTVRLEVKSPIRPDRATVARFRSAVFSLVRRPIDLDLTVIPVDIWNYDE